MKRRFLPYSINKANRHGLALVIVNESFKHPLKRRACAQLDIRRLEKVFHDFQFTVRVEKDKTADEMKDLFEEVSKPGDPAITVQFGDNSFVCCVSSHGYWDPALNTDVVFGINGTVVRKDDCMVPKGALDVKQHAYQSFSPSKPLKGKPKLFFIQACRGSNRGVVNADDIGFNPRPIAAKPRNLPKEADFLFAYATAPGNKAYRNDAMNAVTVSHKDDEGRPYGSFFVSHLSSNLTAYAKKLPLAPILDLVSQDLAAGEDNEFQFREETDSGNIRDIATRQSPNFMSSLHGPVFFSFEAQERYKSKVLSGL